MYLYVYISFWEDWIIFVITRKFVHTVNREYFVVKIFSESLACAKIKCTKYMSNINDNVVQGRLSKNYLTEKFIAVKC